MNTLRLPITLGLGLAVVVVAAAAVVVFQDHLRWRQDQHAVVASLQAANARLLRLQAQNAALSRRLADHPAAPEGAAPKPEKASAGASTNPIARPSTPRPYQVRTYLGNEYLGMSWLVPRNIRTDPKTGHVAYEPVLVLDPGLRGAFTETTTNVVRETVPARAANYNYYYYPVHYPWVWWVSSPATAKEPPSTPRRVPPAMTPSPPRLQPVTANVAIGKPGPWRPVSFPPTRSNSGVNPTDASSATYAPPRNEAFAAR